MINTVSARSKQVDLAVEYLRKGKAATYTEAAEFGGCSPSAVSTRWHKEETGEPPFRPDTEVVARAMFAGDDDETAVQEPTPTERELAKKVLRISAQRDSARTETRGYKNEVTELNGEIGDLRNLLGVVEQAGNLPAPEWLTHIPTEANKHGTLVALFSDYHVGEVVDPSEMNWYNSYDPDIAEKRIKRFFERTIMMSRDYLTGVKYDGIVVPSLGDTVSGDIHDEFRETNEWSNYEASSAVIPWLEEGLGMLADEFGKVHYCGVPGNHPRDSRKPRYKKRVKHNADSFISWQVAQRFSNDDRLTFDIPNGLMADFQVYDTKFRVEHGDEARGGSGIQGAMLPIALMTHRRRKQAQMEGSPFDCLLMGHWHQYMSMVSKGFVVNGAGKGYDEFARGKGFEPEPPQQALMVVTPEYGISVQAPLFVGSRSDEGW